MNSSAPRPANPSAPSSQASTTASGIEMPFVRGYDLEGVEDRRPQFRIGDGGLRLQAPGSNATNVSDQETVENNHDQRIENEHANQREQHHINDGLQPDTGNALSLARGSGRASAVISARP